MIQGSSQNECSCVLKLAPDKRDVARRLMPSTNRPKICVRRSMDNLFIIFHIPSNISRNRY